MAFKLAFRDLGVDCSYIAKGNSIREVLDDGAKHVMNEHGYTEKELSAFGTPEMQRRIEAYTLEDD